MLSPFLLPVVVDDVIEFAREGALSEFLYADDLVLMSETIEGVLKWKEAFESKVNLGKPRLFLLAHFINRQVEVLCAFGWNSP